MNLNDRPADLKTQAKKFFEKRQKDLERKDWIEVSVNIEDPTEKVKMPKQVAEKIAKIMEKQSGMQSNDGEEIIRTADEIQGANCHKTALYLTSHIDFEKLFDNNNIDRENAMHNLIESTTRICSDIGELDYSKMPVPKRLSLFEEDVYGNLKAMHSFVFLGKSNKGRYWAFQKAGAYSDMGFGYVKLKPITTLENDDNLKIGIESVV